MFTHRLKLFELMGFKVHVDLTWVLLAVLVAWSLAVGYFPSVAPGLDSATYWWMGVVGLIGLAFSIVVHEFAHSLVARHYDMPISGITLFVFGGVAEMGDEPSSAKGEFLMAIAGPLTSVGIAGLFWIMGGMLGGAAAGPIALVVGYLAFINLVLAIFNMIPAFPLDGGRVLRAALWWWRGDIMWATRIASMAGGIFAFALMGLGLVSLVGGNAIGGIWWFLIGLFVRAAASGGYQRQAQQVVLSGERVAHFMRANPVAVAPDLTLDRLVEDYVYRHYFKCFPVVEGERIIGLVHLADVRARAPETWSMRNIRSVMAALSDDDVIGPDADAATALAQMQRTGRGRLYVVDSAKHLVGVLSLRDLMNYLAVRLDLDQAGKGSE